LTSALYATCPLARSSFFSFHRVANPAPQETFCSFFEISVIISSDLLTTRSVKPIVFLPRRSSDLESEQIESSSRDLTVHYALSFPLLVDSLVCFLFLGFLQTPNSLPALTPFLSPTWLMNVFWVKCILPSCLSQKVPFLRNFTFLV